MTAKKGRSPEASGPTNRKDEGKSMEELKREEYYDGLREEE